jgi:hypothetical protein
MVRITVLYVHKLWDIVILHFAFMLMQLCSLVEIPATMH